MNRKVIREMAADVLVSAVIVWSAFRASPWYTQCATYIVTIWAMSVIVGMVNG